MQVLTIGMQILTVGTHLGTNPQHNHRDASFNHRDARFNRWGASGRQSSIRTIRMLQDPQNTLLILDVSKHRNKHKFQYYCISYGNSL